MHVVRESNISDNVKENYKYDRVNVDNNEDSSTNNRITTILTMIIIIKFLYTNISA